MIYLKETAIKNRKETDVAVVVFFTRAVYPLRYHQKYQAPIYSEGHLYKVQLRVEEMKLCMHFLIKTMALDPTPSRQKKRWSSMPKSGLVNPLTRPDFGFEDHRFFCLEVVGSSAMVLMGKCIHSFFSSLPKEKIPLQVVVPYNPGSNKAPAHTS